MHDANCYLCHSEDLQIIRNRLRHDIVRNVLKCADCGLVYLEPKSDSRDEYYRGEYREMYTPVLGRKMTPRELFEINKPFQSVRVDALQSVISPASRVLDLGCSAGFFLDALRPYVDELVGIEFNRDDFSFVRDELGIRVHDCPIEETGLEKGSFDLITMWHVLEHIEDPVALLASLRPYLKPNGCLFIEVPNVDDALLSAYRVDAYADFWYREPHAFNFSTTTLAETLRVAGYAGEATTCQRYNFLNHANWVQTGKPQGDMAIGMGDPTLFPIQSASDHASRPEIEAWFRRVNEEYKVLLERHEMGDCLRIFGSIPGNIGTT